MNCGLRCCIVSYNHTVMIDINVCKTVFFSFESPTFLSWHYWYISLCLVVSYAFLSFFVEARDQDSIYRCHSIYSCQYSWRSNYCTQLIWAFLWITGDLFQGKKPLELRRRRCPRIRYECSDTFGHTSLLSVIALTMTNRMICNCLLVDAC